MSKKNNKLPLYMNVLFNKIYGNKKLSNVFDDPRIVYAGNLGATDVIMRDLLHDVTKNVKGEYVGEYIYEIINSNK